LGGQHTKNPKICLGVVHIANYASLMFGVSRELTSDIGGAVHVLLEWFLGSL